MIITIFLGFAAAWASLLAFDTIIFTLTLYKAIVVAQVGEVRLVKLLMRDGKQKKIVILTLPVLINIIGTMYFGFVCENLASSFN